MEYFPKVAIHLKLKVYQYVKHETTFAQMIKTGIIHIIHHFRSELGTVKCWLYAAQMETGKNNKNHESFICAFYFII